MNLVEEESATSLRRIKKDLDNKIPPGLSRTDQLGGAGLTSTTIPILRIVWTRSIWERDDSIAVRVDVTIDGSTVGEANLYSISKWRSTQIAARNCNSLVPADRYTACSKHYSRSTGSAPHQHHPTLSHFPDATYRVYITININSTRAILLKKPNH
jgi:hypothetical protein